MNYDTISTKHPNDDVARLILVTPGLPEWAEAEMVKAQALAKSLGLGPELAMVRLSEGGGVIRWREVIYPSSEQCSGWGHAEIQWSWVCALGATPAPGYESMGQKIERYRQKYPGAPWSAICSRYD